MYFPYLQFASWDNFLHYFLKATCSRGDPLGEVSVPPRYFSQESVSQHGDDLLPEHGGQLGRTFSLFRKKNFHPSIFQQLGEFKAPETDPPLAMDGGNDGKGSGKTGENTNTS